MIAQTIEALRDELARLHRRALHIAARLVQLDEAPLTLAAVLEARDLRREELAIVAAIDRGEELLARLVRDAAIVDAFTARAGMPDRPLTPRGARA